MTTRRFLCLSLGALALCGCRGTATPVPVVAGDTIAHARAEIGDAPPPLRRQLAEGEVTATLRRISRRLEPPAWELCRDLGVGACDWYVAASRSRQLNASAGLDGRVAINRGILEYARSDDEVAFVMAHELAHHAANHVESARDDTSAGAAVGGLLAAVAVAAAAASGARTGAAENRRMIENAAGTGARIGRLAFSQAQEREADRLGLLVLHRAGYDPALARHFVVTMARASRRGEGQRLFETHPSGPERLAAFDATLAELRARGGTLPLRAG
ncbi:M48 family metallopeptidase [Falsiroseomonas sp. CW058]|uniref:M48 family metallopeptidase n=1 Tax=Falsiroseomonas sp. CW058 TaxID=3388664 RepID=UPI003D313B79